MQNLLIVGSVVECKDASSSDSVQKGLLVRGKKYRVTQIHANTIHVEGIGIMLNRDRFKVDVTNNISTVSDDDLLFKLADFRSQCGINRKIIDCGAYYDIGTNKWKSEGNQGYLIGNIQGSWETFLRMVDK